MEKLKKELKKQKDKESSLLEEKDKLKQVPRQCPTFILERTLHLRKERVLIDTENTCLLFPTRFLQWSCNCYLRPRPNVELFIGDEPNTNLGRPKLSWDRLLGQTSNLELVKPINWIRPKSNFNKVPPERAKYTHYHTKFWFINLVRRMWRSTFVPETIFRRSIRLKKTDRTCRTIQTHSDELNWPRRRNFRELNSLSLARLTKSSTFGVGLKALMATVLLFFFWRICLRKTPRC